MKITYLSNMRFPSERAYSRQVVEMCRAFSDLDNDVSLVVNNRKTDIVSSAEDYYGFTFNFSLKRLSIPDIIFLGKLGYIISTLIFSIKAYFYVQKNPTDLIYCRGEWTLALLEFLLPTTPKIYESHEAKYNLPVRFLSRKNIKFVVISEGIRDFYIENDISEDMLFVSHDAISKEFFQANVNKNETREKLGLPNDKKIVMYIGGFDKWKGVDTFFQAGQKSTDLFVAIGGKTEEIKSYSVKYPKVKFLGQLPYKELPSNQSAADVLVIPNTAKNLLSSKYTSPLKLFAHLASKVPLLVSNISSMRNVVSDEEVTFFAPDDYESLLSELNNVISDTNLASEKANKAYSLAHEYTWQNRAQKIIINCT